MNVGCQMRDKEQERGEGERKKERNKAKADKYKCVMSNEAGLRERQSGVFRGGVKP